MSHQRAAFRGWLALVCSVGFLGAAQHCTLEAFASHPTEHHGAQHVSAGAQPHEESSAPAQHDQECTVSCCAAMQAVVTSTIDWQPAWHPAGHLRLAVLRSPQLEASLKLARTMSGLSPPPREPTPARPFYRTTFASHAPPVVLA